MALYWSVDEILNYEKICWDSVDEIPKDDYESTYCTHEDGTHGRLSAITHALIFNSMGIDIGGISEKNVDEVIRRTMLWQEVVGPLLKRREDGKLVDRWITPDEIRMHIGMTTNVGMKTRVAFRSKLERLVQECVDRRLCQWECEKEEVNAKTG